MIKQAERIETIAHLIIDKVAEVASSILKAVVTLVCLGASISYKAGVKAREIFDANYADVETVQETNEAIVVEQISTQEQQMEDVLEDTIIATEKIVDIIQRINIVRPINKPNSLEDFVNTGLRDELSKAYLESICYKLPTNKRTKKAYKRLNNHGILHEHYDFVVNSSLIQKF